MRAPPALFALASGLAACLALAEALPARAAVWYLSPAGHDILGVGSAGSPFRSLARGVQVAADGDSLLLAPGVYAGEGQHDVIVKGRGLSFIGLAGAGQTTVALEGLGGGLSFLAAPADTSRLHGLSFTGGAAAQGGALRLVASTLEVSACRFEANAATDGGAVHLDGASSARFTDCDFAANLATGRGGALWVGPGAALALDRCTLHENLAGDEGGALFWSAAAVGELRNCLLVGNVAQVQVDEQRTSGLAGDQEGFAWVEFPSPPRPWDQVLAASLHLTDTYVERPGLPEAQLALWVDGYGCLELPNEQTEAICHEDYSDPGCANTFASWSGDSLLALVEPWLWPADSLLRVDGDIYHCGYPWNCRCWLAVLRQGDERGWADPVGAFSLDLVQRWHGSGRPQAGGGALLLEAGAQVELLHCTLAGNSSGHSGGALLLAAGAEARLTNCILSGNTAPQPAQLALCGGALALLDRCTVAGEDWGPGNSSAPPAFVDPADFPLGFALADSSPCIAAGNPLDTCDEDLAGRLRPDPPATPPDQGCYESPRGSASAVGEAVGDLRRASLALHPNPARPSCQVQFSLPAASAIDLDVYDVAGRRLRRLWSGTLGPGAHAFAWDGDDEAGRPAASGVYFLRLEAGGASRSEKLVLLR